MYEIILWFQIRLEHTRAKRVILSDSEAFSSFFFLSPVIALYLKSASFVFIPFSRVLMTESSVDVFFSHLSGALRFFYEGSIKFSDRLTPMGDKVPSLFGCCLTTEPLQCHNVKMRLGLK